jgi:hypothetical protein
MEKEMFRKAKHISYVSMSNNTADLLFPTFDECKIKHFLVWKSRKIKVSPDHFAVGNSRENYVENLVFTGISVKGRKWSE